MPDSSSRRIGLIIAAGRGKRMGRTKQLVEWPAAAGKLPLVAAAFDAIRGVCDEMIVVLGHGAELVAAALGERSFHRVMSDADAEMFESIRAGLVAAKEIDSFSVVVLQPGDHPEVSPNTLQLLANDQSMHSECAIMPTFQNRGGHPVFIPPAVIARLILEVCPQGLGEFWRSNPHLCRRIAVEDPNPSVVRDVDTPDQIDRR
jgi:molybdenum cofactor cytidylyltransferase